MIPMEKNMVDSILGKQQKKLFRRDGTNLLLELRRAALMQGIARGWHWLPGFVRRFLAKVLPGVPNPLQTARVLKNRVVSVGSLARPASLDEIRQAVRDRDYRPRSSVDLVIHWTLNDREDFHNSVEAGANAILTDKPDDLVEFMKERGVRVT